MAMFRSKQGIVFITALVMMFILLTLGMVYMMITRSETRITANQINGLKAFYAAEAGVEHSIAELRGGTDDVPPTGLGDVSGSLGSYTYSAEYDDVSIITSTGTGGGATRAIEVEISMSGFTGALQIASTIIANSTHGTVEGDVDAGGSISLDGLVVIGDGTVTPDKEGIVIPSPTLSGYEAIADNFTFDPNNPDGITYIDGNLNIGDSGITVNGTIVVTGNLTMSNAQNFTITPSMEYYPAIVVGNNMNATNIEGSTFNGLVYVGHNASFNHWNNVTIENGAIVVGHSLTLNNGQSVSITFPDSGLDIRYFSGGIGGSVTVNSWQGHPSSP